MLVWRAYSQGECQIAKHTSPYGHVAVVDAVVSRDEIWVVDANWVGVHAGGRHAIHLDDCVNGWYRPLPSVGASYSGASMSRVTSQDDIAYGANRPSLSADGRFVAYEGELSVGSNGIYDIIVLDRSTGTRRRASVDSNQGPTGNAQSARPCISADTRYVTFYSQASNLVVGDANGVSDIFVQRWYDQLGVTVRVSAPATGGESNGPSDNPSVSSDGRYVAFQSAATNLVPGDTNGYPDIFVRDTIGGTTTRVSVASGGAQGNGSSTDPSISADGRFVCFLSNASNLVAGDSNNATDVFRVDRVSGNIDIVTLRADGSVAPTGAAYAAVISGDGQHVAFSTSQFVSNEPIQVYHDVDVFVRDMLTGTTTWASVGVGGVAGDGESVTRPSISVDGRYVAFDSASTNLVSGDTNAMRDIFVRDVTVGVTARVSTPLLGGQANGDSFWPALSSDGRWVAFESLAANLVAGDANGWRDVFVARNPLAP
jgi:Tol biopolymer transport system component